MKLVKVELETYYMPRHHFNKNKQLIRDIIESSIKYNISINARYFDCQFRIYTYDGRENIVLKSTGSYDYYIKKIRKEGLPILWQLDHHNGMYHFPIQNGDMLEIEIHDFEFELYYENLVKFVQEVCIKKIRLNFYNCVYNNRISKEDIRMFCNNIIICGKTQIEFYGYGDFKDIEIDNEFQLTSYSPRI